MYMAYGQVQARYPEKRKARCGPAYKFPWEFTIVFIIAAILFTSSDFAFNRTHTEIDLGHLYSKYAVLADADTGEILASHKKSEKMYPASLTKIMTAILAIENTDDLNTDITLPDEIFPHLYEDGASMAGFLPNEEAKGIDLLYGIMLPSGAECCEALAEQIAGSQEHFAEIMNEKAREIGMKDTHFCNSTGLHDPAHYSTAEDITVLLRYALQNETFREIFTCREYSTGPSAMHPEGFTFYSTMFDYINGVRISGVEILGGKTGYTSKAGQCLASLAEISGKEYILVTAKAVGITQRIKLNIADAMQVYGQVRTNFCR